MQSEAAIEENTVTNEVDHSGWRYTESTVAAPNLNTTEKQLKDKFQKVGREGLTLTEYIIASQDAKVLEGKYFDKDATWFRLLGSRDGAT